ncbi:MAG: CRTAC1 family protein [Planctomyces sp.]|nr:CRTAC1 family protein [Planctomyces sp.]
MPGCRPQTTTPAPAAETVPETSATTEQTATPPPSAAKFDDLTERTGIDFTCRNGDEAGHCAMIETLGGGVAAIDFDGDGLEDLCFAGGGGYDGQSILGLPLGLYRNLGDWAFRDASEVAHVNAPGPYSHGVNRGDYNGDGFPDLLITGYAGLQLFENQGDGTFHERAAEAGLTDALWSSSSAWGDFDGDGSLDLYVAHYVDWSWDNHPVCAGFQGYRDVCPPRSFQDLPDTLYLSNGDGTFRDGTTDSGMRQDGKGLGVIVADFNDDGRPDIYVANDTVPNHLYANQGASRFIDVSLISGTSMNDRGNPDGSMGVDVFDFNGDRLPDLWVVNYENESAALYRNDGDLFFRHVSQPTGVTATGGLFVGWGTACFDVDLDGDEDIFVSNGHVLKYPTGAPLRQRPLLFENVEGRRFPEIGRTAGEYLELTHMGRGAATGDFDGDGALDLAVSHMNEPVAILRNASNPKGRWLNVELYGVRSSRDPIGARVTLKTSSGEQVRFVKGGGSYASSVARTLHFGLGDAETVGWVEIRWPSGLVERVTDVTPASCLRKVEGVSF